MRYYRVPAIGDGSRGNPIRPDLPPGTSWVGSRGPDGSFLVATPAPIAGAEIASEQLGAECQARGLELGHVRSWRVG